jgi:hypothetical protein
MVAGHSIPRILLRVVGVVAMDATVVEAAAVAEEASMVAKQRRRSSASSATESATRCYGATSRDENGQKRSNTKSQM